MESNGNREAENIKVRLSVVEREIDRLRPRVHDLANKLSVGVNLSGAVKLLNNRAKDIESRLSTIEKKLDAQTGGWSALWRLLQIVGILGSLAVAIVALWKR